MPQNERSGAPGFILPGSFRVASGSHGQRTPIVHIHGRLEGGDTFLVRDDRQRPHFYIRTSDVERARALRPAEPQPTGKRSFAGAAVSVLETEIPQDVPGLRDRLHAAGVETFEADVRFALRYLIDRGIRGGCEIDGEWAPGKGVARGYVNPTRRPAEAAVDPRVLSFAIERAGTGGGLLAF